MVGHRKGAQNDKWEKRLAVSPISLPNLTRGRCQEFLTASKRD